MEKRKKESYNAINYFAIARNVINNSPIYYDKSNIWYVWKKEESKWEIVDETEVLSYVRNENDEIVNLFYSNIKSATLNALKIEARERQPNELKKTEVQFRNKIIDVKTGEEREVTAKDFTFNPIQWELSDSEETPMMDKFISECVGEKYLKTLYQWMAYHLIQSYPIHRAIVLNGSGSNGKSTFIDLMKKFLGEDNITAGDFQSVFVTRFGTSILYKKLGVFMPEADFSKIDKTAVFKSATGNDPLLVEFKGRGAFTYENYAKVTISTNSLPITLDKTDGFYRRFLIIDFPNKFTEKFDILSKIPEQEYKNLTRKCVNILKELLNNGRFHNEGSIEERREKYERISNPLQEFIKERVIESPDKEISKREFRTEANKWLKEKGHRQLTNNMIVKIMRDEYAEGHTRIYDGDKKTKSERAWLGITWKECFERLPEKPIIEEEIVI